MNTLKEAIDNRIANLKSTVVKSDDYDYLSEFNADISSLVKVSVYDILLIYYLIRENNDLEIAKSFVSLFVVGKINCEQCNALLSFVNYHIPEEILNAKPKVQLAFAKDFLKK